MVSAYFCYLGIRHYCHYETRMIIAKNQCTDDGAVHTVQKLFLYYKYIKMFIFRDVAPCGVVEINFTHSKRQYKMQTKISSGSGNFNHKT